MTETVPVASPISKAKIELLASSILARYAPEAAQGKTFMDIESFFELDLPRIEYLRSLKTGYADLASLGYYAGAFGVTDASAMLSMVDSRLADRDDTTGRRVFRATVGHEASHCLLHVPALRQFRSVVSQNGPLFRSRNDIKPYLDPEWQAWGLCGALLMPKIPFTRMVAQGVSDYELAEFFDVNPAFARRRIKFLGLN